LNQADRKEFDLIHSNIEQIRRSVNEMKVDADAQHEMIRQDVKFIKENLFNPHEGLWAETKLNSQFRQNTTKWRVPVGTGFIALFVKHIWDYFIRGS
jgi:hypothetical protein